jgi:hypothetical protein
VKGRMRMKKFFVLAVLLIASLIIVTACGGSSDDEPTTSPSPSPSPTVPAVNGDDPANGDDPLNGDDPENGDDPVNGDDPANGEDDPANGEDDPANGEDDPDNGEEPAAGFVFATVPARPAGVVYSLSTDVLFQSLPVNTVGAANIFQGGAFGEGYDGTPYITTAGNPTFRTVANPRSGVSVGLSITNREQPHYSIDLVWGEVGINTSANSYEVTVYGSTGASTNMRLAGAVSPWAGVGTISVAADGAFTLQGVVTAENLEAAGASGQLRIHSNDTVPFNIYEIVVRRVDRVVAPPPAVVPPRPANMIYSLEHDAAFQGLAHGTTGQTAEVFGDDNSHLQNSGQAQFEVVANPNAGIANGFRVFNREADWHTFDIMLANAGMNLAANTYTVRVVGRVVNAQEGTTVHIMGISGGWGRFNRPRGEANINPDTDYYFNVGEPLVGSTFDTTALITAERMAEYAGPAEAHRVRFAIGGAGASSDFIIYRLEITRN